MTARRSAGPAGKVGGRWLTLFTLAWLAIWTAQLTPLQLLLPLQLDTPDSASGWVSGVVSSGIVLGVGGLAGVLASPLAGALSDRGSGSRRRPWALGGVWLAAACLVLTGFSTGPWLVGASWVGVSVGIAVASAAFTSMIADQLPVEQRGAAASAVSSSQAVGIVFGVAAIVLLGLSVVTGYLVLAVTIALLGSAAALFLPDPPARARPAHGAVEATPTEHSATSGLLTSLADRDFAWMLLGRLVVNIGNALGTGLLLFFLLYGLGQEHASAETNLLLLIVVYTVFVVLASIGVGVASDRLGHRRTLTIACAVVQASAGAVILMSPSFTMTMVAAALMGFGYGGFSSVGLAFATDLLPSSTDNARDLGVVNVSSTLGQLLGPVIGAGLVALVGGFWLLFLGAATMSLVGAGLTALAREHRDWPEIPDPATNLASDLA